MIIIAKLAELPECRECDLYKVSEHCRKAKAEYHLVYLPGDDVASQINRPNKNVEWAKEVMICARLGERRTVTHDPLKIYQLIISKKIIIMRLGHKQSMFVPLRDNESVMSILVPKPRLDQLADLQEIVGLF